MVTHSHHIITFQLVFIITGKQEVKSSVLKHSLIVSKNATPRHQCGFRPRTMAAYHSKLCIIAFLAHLQFSPPDSFQAVAMFLEYLAQEGLRAQTITNYVSVLSHYFTLYGLDTSLAIRAVARNASLSFKVKDILSINKRTHSALLTLPDHIVYTTICRMAFFGFYHLATLVPPLRAGFSSARYLTHGDIIWCKIC